MATKRTVTRKPATPPVAPVAPVPPVAEAPVAPQPATHEASCHDALESLLTQQSSLLVQLEKSLKELKLNQKRLEKMYTSCPEKKKKKAPAPTPAPVQPDETNDD